MRKSRPFLFSNICISLVIIMVLSLMVPVCPAIAKSNSSGDADYTEGDNVYFGNLDGKQLNWTILTYDSATGIAFVVAKTPINTKSVTDYKKQLFNSIPDEKNRGYITWSNNGWRTWLNNSFMNTAFTKAQRGNIQKTTITKESQQNSIMNFFHDTSLDAAYAREQVKYDLDLDIYNNQPATSDYIFFLSTDEYTAYKDKIGISGNEKWALRTNSYYAKNRTNCVDDSNAGLIEPYYHYNNTAIRPAMYVKIKEVVAEEKETEKKTNTKTENKTDTTNKNSGTTANSATTTSQQTTTGGASASTAVSARNYANNATDIKAAGGNSINLPDEGEHNISKGSQAVTAIDLNYLNYTRKKYTVTYTSSDNSIFTVDSAGNVSAVGIGSAILTVKMKKSNGKIYNMSCRINVQ